MFNSVMVPLPFLIIEPPAPVMCPAILVEFAVPKVRVPAPRATVVPAEVVKSPIVIPEVALISKIPVLTVTAPVEARDPVLDRAKVPAEIVVPPE